MPNGELDYVNQRVLDYFERRSRSIVASGWTAGRPSRRPSAHARSAGSRRSTRDSRTRTSCASGARPTTSYRWHLTRAVPMRDRARRDREVVRLATRTSTTRSAPRRRSDSSSRRARHSAARSTIARRWRRWRRWRSRASPTGRASTSSRTEAADARRRARRSGERSSLRSSWAAATPRIPTPRMARPHVAAHRRERALDGDRRGAARRSSPSTIFTSSSFASWASRATCASRSSRASARLGVISFVAAESGRRYGPGRSRAGRGARPPGRRLRSRTRSSTARSRSARRRRACSRPSPTACSSSTATASCASGTRRPRRSRGCDRSKVLGRTRRTRCYPGWNHLAGARPVAARPARLRPRRCPSSWAAESDGSRSRASASTRARCMRSAT